MRLFAIITVVCCGGLLLLATQDFPVWGDPNSPASTHLSPYYIEKSVEVTGVPNLVTAVLADFRGYDTLFETTVVFCAGLACFILLRRYLSKIEYYYFRHIPTDVTLRIKDPAKIPKEDKEFERIDALWVPHDLIIKTMVRIITPFIFLFALYVVAHGDFSPGGGFQGGVIFGAGAILLAIAFDLRSSLHKFKERLLGLLCAVGVVIYSGIGILCMFLQGNFLDYSKLAKILPVDPIHVRALGMLGVEVGVGFAVMAVMVVIYVNIASAGKLDEGL